ncbi:hypothetical protein Cantr_08652 [Candida viswanathii]|uniref:50S ribosomal protein L35 n=1 Tax=Candida viswanathii TaxID=5486 RepID=A0A367Y5Q9_9ASCO|nr:hypothetical protein Cantr_08652 [Candida viswanathii]
MFLNFIQNASRSLFGNPSAVNFLTQTRFKHGLRTQKAITNRFIQRANGLKRKRSGVNHGNGKFSAPSLAHLRGTVHMSKKGGYLKKYLEHV